MEEGGQRRSARISALEASKSQDIGFGLMGEDKYIDKGKQIMAVGQGSNIAQPSAKEKSKKKRKLKLVEEVVGNSVAIQQNPTVPNNVQPSNPVQPPSPTDSLKLDKRAYELIIEILEKKDELKIFAQPVDPNEVEGYYEIIKEPMDFGTIKKKIQDGEYTSLKEFERDVTLVHSNCISFNGGGNIYGDMGYIIKTLATEILNAVKADPAHYEAALSPFRSQARGKPEAKVPNVIPTGRKKNIASRGRKSASDVDVSRRISRPSDEFLSHNESLASTVYESSKQLVTSNGGIGYNESLMRFTKGMGPIVQNIVRQKLLPPSHGPSTESGFSSTPSNGPNTESLLSLTPSHGPNKESGSSSTKQRRYPFHASQLQVGSLSLQPRKSPVRGTNLQIQPPSTVQRQKSQTGLSSTQGWEYRVHGPNSQIGSLSTQESPNPPHNNINVPRSQNVINNFSGLGSLSNPPKSVLDIPPSRVLPSSVPYNSERVVNDSTSQNFIQNISGHSAGPTVGTDTYGQLDFRRTFREETSHEIHNSETPMGFSFPVLNTGLSTFSANGLANFGTGYVSPVNSENRQISRPGPSYRVSPDPRWNQQSQPLQSLANEQYGARVGPLSTCSSSTSILGQVMGWAGPSPTVESSALGGANLQMAKPVPNASINSVEVSPVPQWNHASFGLPSLAAGGQEIGAPGLALRTQETPVSSPPNWHQPNLDSQFLGVGNQGLDSSNFGIDLTRVGSDLAPTPVQAPVLEWNRQGSFSQQNNVNIWNSITRPSDVTSFNQNWVSLPEPQLAQLPEVLPALPPPPGFYETGPTRNVDNQTELSNLASMDYLSLAL